jgi:hypothetical protein
VSRLFPALLLWFALGASACHAATPTLSITYADRPLSLIRGTELFSAGRGVILQRDDLLASATGVVLLDADGATVAIGPASRVFVSRANELVLLEGWLKVQGRPGPGLRIRTPGLHLTTTGATAMLRVTPAASAIFAETGEVAIDEAGSGKAARRLRLLAEQYAVRMGSQPARILPRPQADYLAAMPQGFRDVLVAVPRTAIATPKRERALTYAEVAPWLSAQPDLRQRVQQRFHLPKAGSNPARSSNQPPQGTQ